MKRILSLALALALCLCLSAGAYGAGPGAESGGLIPVAQIDGELYIRLDDLLGLPGPARGAGTVLKGAALLDAAHEGEKLDVRVENGIITEIGADLTGGTVIDLTGCTLLPGLIDAHVHIAGSADYQLEVLQTFCAAGITAVRELGMLSALGQTDYAPLVAAANADNGAARLVSCGDYVDVAGGYGSGPFGGFGHIIASPEAAAQAVRDKSALGYTQVKIGVNTFGVWMTDEEFSAVIDTAHALGMPVSAHINTCADLEYLLPLGIDEAAHTPADAMSPALIAAMARDGVRMNTSGAADAAVKTQNLSAFFAAGGVITVGTDLMRGYGACMEKYIAELQSLTAAGLTVQQAVTCATHNNAEALGLDCGDIAVGLCADFVAVAGSVDESFTALKAPVFVMRGGEIAAGG